MYVKKVYSIRVYSGTVLKYNAIVTAQTAKVAMNKALSKMVPITSKITSIEVTINNERTTYPITYLSVNEKRTVLKAGSITLIVMRTVNVEDINGKH